MRRVVRAPGRAEGKRHELIKLVAVLAEVIQLKEVAVLVITGESRVNSGEANAFHKGSRGKSTMRISNWHGLC